ncbi:MAG: RDD family protein [Actinobacteria bacterium]|nr:RDD family protein [Actinomycetota bacterium]
MPTGPDSFPASGANSLASIARRAVARAVDWALLGLALAGVAFVLSLDPLNGEPVSPGARAVALALSWALMNVVYEGVLTTWRGRTLGKAAVGIRVARLVDGRSPLWWQSGMRVGVPVVVEVVPGLLGAFAVGVIYWAAAWDPMRRGLHDRAAGTVVVNVR